MTAELGYPTLVTILTGLLGLPSIVDRISAWGLADTVGYPAQPRPQSARAQRLMKAHANAVENRVVFAALVLMAQAAGVSNGATAAACAVYSPGARGVPARVCACRGVAAHATAAG